MSQFKGLKHFLNSRCFYWSCWFPSKLRSVYLSCCMLCDHKMIRVCTFFMLLFFKTHLILAALKA